MRASGGDPEGVENGEGAEDAVELDGCKYKKKKEKCLAEK